MISYEQMENKIFDALNRKASIEEIKLLINAPGVGIDFNDEHFMTPLMYASYQGNVDVIKLLISYGSDVNYTCHSDRYTSLMFAALSGKEEAVLLLLENNANIYDKNKLGRNASQMASFVGYNNIAKLITNFVPLANVECIAHDIMKNSKDESNSIKDERIVLSHLCHDIQVFVNSTNFNLLQIIKSIIHHPNLLKHNEVVNAILKKLGGLVQDIPREDEILSLRCHYVNHLLTYISNSSNNMDDMSSPITKDMQLHATQFLKCLVKDPYQHKGTPGLSLEEKYLRQMIKDYPHKGDGIFKNVMIQLNSPHLYKGESPSAASVLITTFGGLPSPLAFQGGDHDKACNVCCDKKNVKVCLKCHKVYYCDSECQKLDWPYHKNLVNEEMHKLD